MVFNYKAFLNKEDFHFIKKAFLIKGTYLNEVRLRLTNETKSLLIKETSINTARLLLIKTTSVRDRLKKIALDLRHWEISLTLLK